MSVWVTGAGSLRRGPQGAPEGECEEGQAAVGQSVGSQWERQGGKCRGAGGRGCVCPCLRQEDTGAKLSRALDTWASGERCNQECGPGVSDSCVWMVVSRGGYQAGILESECLG